MGSVSFVDSRFVIRNVFSCGFFSISQTKIYANVKTPKRKPGSFVQRYSFKFRAQGYVSKNKNNDIDNDKLQCFTKKLNFSINIKKYALLLNLAVFISSVSIMFDSEFGVGAPTNFVS